MTQALRVLGAQRVAELRHVLGVSGQGAAEPCHERPGLRRGFGRQKLGGNHAQNAAASHFALELRPFAGLKKRFEDGNLEIRHLFGQTLSQGHHQTTTTSNRLAHGHRDESVEAIGGHKGLRALQLLA